MTVVARVGELQPTAVPRARLTRTSRTGITEKWLRRIIHLADRMVFSGEHEPQAGRHYSSCLLPSSVIVWPAVATMRKNSRPPR
jgi:hypothetical protein